MQSTIAFVILFSLRTISLAADVTVYDTHDYYNKEPQYLESVAESRFPWMFSFDSFLMYYIQLKNTSPSVTAINITCNIDDRTFEMKRYIQEYGPRKHEDYTFYFNSSLVGNEIEIKLNLYSSNMLCSSLLVAKGTAVENITNELLKQFPLYTRLKYSFVLVVDLINKCDGPPSATETQMNSTIENAGTDLENMNPNNTYLLKSSTNLEITTNKNSAIDTRNDEQQPSLSLVLLYVIPSVVGMCVIILLIYLISVKKYCRRNSNPVETLELNTYSTANEVLYADLGFVHGDSQPPRSDEESPYARIIGVLKPAD